MLGENVRSRRIELGIGQVALAQKTGIPAQSLWRIEAGEITSPRLPLLVKLADALGVTLDELVRGKRPRRRKKSSWNPTEEQVRHALVTFLGPNWRDEYCKSSGDEEEFVGDMRRALSSVLGEVLRERLET